MNLTALHTPAKRFALLGLDVVPQLAQQLGLDVQLDQNKKFMTELTELLAQTLSGHASGVVLDANYSFPVMDKLNLQPGLIFRLDQVMPELDPLALPQLVPNWGVEEIRNNYAVAELQLWYHPAEQNALIKKQMVAELADFCQHEKIAFILKLLIHQPTQTQDGSSNFQEDQIQAIQEFRNSCDILAIQFPLDALTAATVTAELDVPWVVVLEGMEYESAKDALRMSLESGAQGFMISEGLWSEIASIRRLDMAPDVAGIESFIKTTAQDRLIELARIVDEQKG